MESLVSSFLPLAFFTFIIGLVVVVVMVVSRSSQEDEERKQADDSAEGNHTQRPMPTKKSSKSSSSRRHASAAKDVFAHRWLLTTLKGHSGSVLDMSMSENNRYLATCSEDRSVILWMSKEFRLGSQHRLHRVNVGFDEADHVAFSPDNKAFVIHRRRDEQLEVFKLDRRADNHEVNGAHAVLTFPKHGHESVLIAVEFASSGKFIMTCDSKSKICLWDLKGQLLTSIDTCLMTNYCAKISSCGRFVAASGFAPDVNVWEVKFDRSNDFKGVHKAYQMTGHSSGVFSFDYNGDASRAITFSKDGFWRLFQTPIDLQRDDKCPLLHKGRVDANLVGCQARIALSKEALVAALSNHNCVVFIDVNREDDQELERIEDVHVEGQVQRLLFDKEDRWLLTCGDKHVRVLHNVPGFQLKLKELRAKLKVATSQGMKEMLQEQIERIEATLKSIV